MSNTQSPKIQSNGYNGSEPTRECPHCKKTKPLSEFGYRNMGKWRYSQSILVQRM